MICRDFMLRVCCRNPCKMHHVVKICRNASCNGNMMCKFLHNLTTYEVEEVNENIRPFRENVYKEMKRLAYILRESFPTEIRTHACSLYMLGECIWPCLTCGTASNNINNCNKEPACNKCYILLKNTKAMEALFCGHVYCKHCKERLPIQVDGPIPVWCCVKCEKWTGFFKLCK